MDQKESLVKRPLTSTFKNSFPHRSLSSLGFLMLFFLTHFFSFAQEVDPVGKKEKYLSSEEIEKRLKGNQKSIQKEEKIFKKLDQSKKKAKKELTDLKYRINSHEDVIHDLNKNLLYEKNRKGSSNDRILAEEIKLNTKRIRQRLNVKNKALFDLQKRITEKKEKIEQTLYEISKIKRQLEILRNSSEQLRANLEKARFRESLMGR